MQPRKLITLIAMTALCVLAGLALRRAWTVSGPETSSSGVTREDSSTARVRAAYGRLPLSFEANQGQAKPQVKFLARGRGYSLFLTSQEAVLALSPPADHPTVPLTMAAHGAIEAVETPSVTPPPAVVRMQLVGAKAAPPVAGRDALPGKSHT